MIEERQPRLEAAGHRRPVGLAQQVAGQIARRVSEHHSRNVRQVGIVQVDVVGAGAVDSAEDRGGLAGPLVAKRTVDVGEAVGVLEPREGALQPRRRKRFG